MLRLIRLRSTVVPLAAMAAMAFACGNAAAKDVPFTIIGGGVATSGLPLPGQPARSHWSVGVAPHLGVYLGDGKVKTDSAVQTNPTTIGGQFGSGTEYVFHGAGGKLVTWYGRTDHGAAAPGTFVLTIVGATSGGVPIVTARFVAEFVIDPAASTGRFAGVTGSWIMIADTEPFMLGSTDPVNYSWEGQGRIRLK